MLEAHLECRRGDTVVSSPCHLVTVPQDPSLVTSPGIVKCQSPLATPTLPQPRLCPELWTYTPSFGFIALYLFSSPQAPTPYWHPEGPHSKHLG